MDNVGQRSTPPDRNERRPGLLDARRRDGLCSMCGEPLTDEEKALEGVGGSYVRCDECAQSRTSEAERLAADPRILIPGETELWQKVAELIYADVESDTPPRAVDDR